MGLIAKIAWIALPALAGCGVLSQVSSQGTGTNPGGKATGFSSFAFPNEADSLDASIEKGGLTLTKKYQQPLSFGISEQLFNETVDTVVLNAVKSVRHEGGKKAAYWRERVFSAVDSEIKKLNFTPSDDLTKFLKALAGEVWVKSLVRPDKDISAHREVSLRASNRIELHSDIILGDSDPRGSCTSYVFPVTFFHQGAIGTVNQMDVGFAGIEAYTLSESGKVGNTHSWNYVRIGGRILQSEPTFTKISRDAIQSLNSITKLPTWHLTMAGRDPLSAQKFLATHWLPFGYKNRLYTVADSASSWTPLSFEEWKSIVTSSNKQ